MLKLFNYPKIVERLKELSTDKTLRYLNFDMYAGPLSGGFGWRSTSEGHEFWRTVIEDDNPELAISRLSPSIRDSYYRGNNEALINLGYSIEEAKEILKV